MWECAGDLGADGGRDEVVRAADHERRRIDPAKPAQEVIAGRAPGLLVEGGLDRSGRDHPRLRERPTDPVDDVLESVRAETVERKWMRLYSASSARSPRSERGVADQRLEPRHFAMVLRLAQLSREHAASPSDETGAGFMRTRPETRSGWADAYSSARRAPQEWPRTTTRFAVNGRSHGIEVGHLGGDRHLGDLTGERPAPASLVVVDETDCRRQHVELGAEVLVVEVGSAVDGDHRRVRFRAPG